MVLNRGFLRTASLILSALVVVCISLYYSFDASLNRQKTDFENDAQTVAASYRSAMDVVDGIATSVSAVHAYRSGSTAQDSVAKTLLGNYSFVSGFGRFDSVDSDQLSDYTKSREHLTENTGPAIWWFDQAGNRITTGTDSRGLPSLNGETGNYYPVTLNLASESDVAPDGEVASATGFDLGSYSEVNYAIQRSTETGRTVIAPAPPSWSNPNTVFAIRSLYNTPGVPRKVRERREMMAGGYWLQIDFNELGLSSELLDRFGVALNLIESESEFSMDNAALLHNRPVPESDLLFSDWLSQSEWLSSFMVGNQTFTIRITQPRGLTTSAFLSWLLIAAGLLGLLGIIVALNAKRHRAVRRQKQQSERLFREQQRASVTLSSIGDAVISADVDGNIQYVNNAAEEMLEAISDKVIGLPIQSIFRTAESDHGGRRKTKVNPHYYLTEEVISCDKYLLRVDGSKIAVNETVSPVRGVDGTRDGSVIVLRDVTAEKELTRQLEHQINHDPLTGLANRFNFDSRLKALFEQKEDNEPGHGLCLIDLDKFKQVNDTCGHAAGDQLLIELSVALGSRIRTEDMLARLGGDEFAIVLENCTHDAAVGVANRIHRFFNTYHFEFDDKVFPVRGSIGLVHFKPEESQLEKVVSAADSACYEAKNKGRNSVHVYSAEDINGIEGGSEELWLPRIESALKDGGFTLFLQPICSLADNAPLVPVHHEFFVRMQDPERADKLYYPLQFMKSAERYGLMVEIDQWVVRRSIEFIASLPAIMADDIFSLNLSAASLTSSDFANFMADVLGQHNVDGSRLCIELTEESVLNNLDAASTTTAKLKKLGCSIALDDFGAGVSSLSSLRELMVDYLKIDGQFISDIDNSHVDESMVRSISSFAKSMELSTIAEKVETRSARKLLAKIGVDYVQGYVIAKPVPIDEYIGSLRPADERKAA